MTSSSPCVGVIFTLADLYRQRAPETGERLGRHWRGTLERLLGGEARLHIAETAHTPRETAAAVASCEKADCDLLLVLPLAYAPSGAARDALCATALPLLVVSSARDATLPFDMGAEHLRANQAMHGVQDLANVLRRAGRRFHLLAGHPDHERFRERLRLAVRAGAAARVLRRGRVGRIGEPFRGMLDFAFDPAGLAERLGFQVVEIHPQELATATQSVDAAQIAAFTDWVHESFRVDPTLSAEELRAAALWSTALESLTAQRGLDAVAVNFQALLEAGAATLPFLGADRLMSRGVGYAGEGDVLTAALTAALARMAGRATFTETFCPDYRRGQLLLSHMGECNLAMADPKRPPFLKPKPFDMGDCIRPAVAVFQLTPGPVTLASISEAPGNGRVASFGFQLAAFEGSIDASVEHPNLTSPYSRLGVGSDLTGFLERYSRCGGTHHLALAPGRLLSGLGMLADYCGLSLAAVDTGSARR